ncbi:MAG: tRNA (N6-isopentenyl adenosine(37)-C2)-methylthiotransferase MiaB, partial [Bacteroidales bacterium]|nr:tRNA (N6-isopentenyl adenosine(37)-C2)-methylthiotransferase MiaB [Bacteroidales bacterium]
GLILINTCSVRENAEQRVWNRLRQLRYFKKKNPDLIVGLAGCMAERLREKLFDTEDLIDIVAGPDSYRYLPSLVAEAGSGRKAINVRLSSCETYSDMLPAYPCHDGITAFISIMRGCNNMCSYCIVPYVRGAERSRNPESILKEARMHFESGSREVTLLGQNVDSYKWTSGDNTMEFHSLLAEVAAIDPRLRVRFTTSHPKDLSDELLKTMAEKNNICKHIHLPFQSGSNRILRLMNREYTRGDYMSRIESIRRIIPECSVSTDIISGFCTETDEDHKETLSLMEWAGFDFAYMFRYSERPGTLAARKLRDDVSEEIKIKRLNEIISLQNSISRKSKKNDLGKIHEVLVEGYSKRSKEDLTGRTSQNKVVVFPGENRKKGDYVNVFIEKCTSATLAGRII